MQKQCHQSPPWFSHSTSPAGLVLALTACAPATPATPTRELVGADETVSATGTDLGQTVGSTLVSTTGVNLRSSPSTSAKVLHVVPSGASVTLEASAPSNGFYKIKHGGVVGWSFGKYYTLKSSGTGTGSPPPAGDVRAAALARAKSAVGYSYWWGHAARRRLRAPRGLVLGNCPTARTRAYAATARPDRQVWQVSITAVLST
jgi:hypothetical protein